MKTLGNGVDCETPRPRGAFLPGHAPWRRATRIGIEKFYRLRPEYDWASDQGKSYADVDAARVIDIPIFHRATGYSPVGVVTFRDERPVVTPGGIEAAMALNVSSGSGIPGSGLIVPKGIS